MNLKMKRLAAAILTAIICLSTNVVTAFSAVSVPTVTNGMGYAYYDNGISFIDADTDVFITPANNTTYYYAFKQNSVDVYYAGETGNPVGSWFEGPLKNGAFVTTITIDVNKASGTPVGASDGWKINVPKPTHGEITELYIIAYSGDESSKVYKHSFLSAEAQLIITDGGETVFADKGFTVTDSATDVFITNPQPDTAYYYSFDMAGISTVDVYYAGENGSPTGSYFEGPLVNGAFVATLSNPGNLTPVGSDYKISVPAPNTEGDQSLNLYITAVKNGISKVVYTHKFALKYCFSVSFDTNVYAEFENNSSAEFSGYAILAIYNSDNGLVFVEQNNINADAYSSVDLEFNLDTSLYPVGTYRYAVFCWDSDYIPVTLAIRK